jgi:lipopolysaccharide export system permease protein
MILHAYLARKFAWTLFLMMLVFMVLLGLIDLVDELQDFPEPVLR